MKLRKLKLVPDPSFCTVWQTNVYSRHKTELYTWKTETNMFAETVVQKKRFYWHDNDRRTCNATADFTFTDFLVKMLS